MYKLRLILADQDSRYVDVVTAYINSAYSFQISVIAFTKPQLLEEYLSQNVETIDILLAQQEFLQFPRDSYANVQLTVALNDGGVRTGEQFPSLYKYQPGDKLVTSLLDLYGQQNNAVTQLVTGDTASVLVSVYSPVGGVGKSSVALALASKLTELGKRVFYLNLEAISSLGVLVTNSGSNAMSQVLLALMETPHMLQLKLEMYKTTDSLYGFDYLEPPDCFRELSEVGVEDVRVLLQTLKTLGKYDLILIDTNAAGDEKTMVVLENSDRILLVQTPEPLCQYKTATFLEQIRRMAGRDLIGKATLVTNKFTDEAVQALGEYDLQARFMLPLINNLWVSQNQSLQFDVQRRFTEGITPLAEALL